MWVTIPFGKFHCENYCFTDRTVPVQICKSATIHKSQDIRIGLCKDWVKVLINIPVKQVRSQTGIDLVDFLTATSMEPFYIHVKDLNGVIMEDTKTIVQGKCYNERSIFE